MRTGSTAVLTCDGVIGYASAAYGDLVFLDNTVDRWEKTDSDAEGSSGDVMLGLVVSTGSSDGDACVLMTYGFMREDDWDWTSAGDALYVENDTDGDPGTMVVAAPNDSTQIVRVAGYAGQNADTVFFNPSGSWVEIA